MHKKQISQDQHLNREVSMLSRHFLLKEVDNLINETQIQFFSKSNIN
jgi:hypothetical protein